MEKGRTVNIKRHLNRLTCPFRAIYATIAVAVWEVLSFGVLAPYITSLWNYVYLFFELDETDTN